MTLSTYLSLHLLASLYLEGLHRRDRAGKLPFWCVYPGHDGAQTGVLNSFATIAARLFRERYTPDLILRHKPAIKSAYARYHNVPITIGNQLQTIHINPQAKIVGRSVLVFDDFTTEAYSFETARNFLLNAGATSVICIAVGKYPGAYYARTLKPGVTWNSSIPSSLDGSEFVETYMTFSQDARALTCFQNLT
jgi:hypothetical protein